MIFVTYLITAVFGFFCIWLSIIIFNNKLDNKVLRSVILAVLMSAISLISGQLGGFGLVIGFIINFILVMKLLGLDFLSTIFFTIGLSLLSNVAVFGLTMIFPNTPKALPEKNTAISTITEDVITDDSEPLDAPIEPITPMASKADDIAKIVDVDIDTDGDGLIDSDELDIYKTDPNKVDTDGDGYADGDEVKGKFNPLGSGKLGAVPRIMMWSGKVNQHWDLDKGVWLSDPDRKSGEQLNKLTYCKKFYPNTISVVEYKNETINTWSSGGGGEEFTNTKMSYRCILKN